MGWGGHAPGSTRRPCSRSTRPLEPVKFARGDVVVADAALLVGRRCPENEGPFGPGVVVGAVLGRLRHDLELVDDLSSLSVGGAEAVGAGVASAEDDDALALCLDTAGRVDALAGVEAVLLGEVLHGVVYAG